MMRAACCMSLLLAGCGASAPAARRPELLVTPGCIPAGWERPPEEVGQSPGSAPKAPASSLRPFEGSGAEGSGAAALPALRACR